MNIVFGVCCWISEESQLGELRRCLDSVKEYRVILVNGKWYDIEGDYPDSLPEAHEIISRYPNVEVITAINRHEWENRNLYLERCNEDDVLIVLDTDEYVEGVISEQEISDDDSFMVMGVSKRHGGDVVLKRGIRYPSETRHKDRHNEYWRNDTKLRFFGRIPNIFKIIEDKSYRSDDIGITMKKRAQLRPFR